MNISQIRSFKKPYDTIRIANCRNFRSCDNDCLISSGNRIAEPLFNSRRAIQQYIIEFFSELICEFDHLLRRHCRFIFGLCRRQKKKIRITSVLDQCLFHSAASIDNIHQIIHNPILQAKDHIQITKAYIRIHYNCFFVKHRKSRSDIGNCGCFTHTPFSGCYYNDFSHFIFLLIDISRLLVFSYVVLLYSSQRLLYMVSRSRYYWYHWRHSQSEWYLHLPDYKCISEYHLLSGMHFPKCIHLQFALQ